MAHGGLHRFAIPTRNRQVVFVALQHFLVIVDQRITVFDGAQTGEDRLVRHPLLPVYAEVPLQVTDPQNELCDFDRARVDF